MATRGQRETWGDRRRRERNRETWWRRAWDALFFWL